MPEAREFHARSSADKANPDFKRSLALRPVRGLREIHIHSDSAAFTPSDRYAAYPADKPVSPHDLVATMYHALGVPHDDVLHGSLNRPRYIRADRAIEDAF